MTGLEVAVGFLVAWTVRRAKHLGDGLGTEADRVLDKALEALHKLITGKLGGDSALAQLESEADRDGDASPRTRQRVQLALEDAVERDTDFAGQLDTLLKQAERVVHLVDGPSTQNSGVVTNAALGVAAGPVTANDQGVAFGSVLGSVTVTQSDRSVTTCQCSRDAIGRCLECNIPLCSVHNQATRQRAIVTPNLVATLTVQALWAAAADKVLCGECFTSTEEDLLRSLPVTPLPSDPNPVIRLIELADRSYWSTRQHMPAWISALNSAVDELGGQSAVFDAAAAAVLNRTEVENFPGPGWGYVFEGAIAGEQVRTYQVGQEGIPTGRFAVVNRNLHWYYVHEVAKPGRYNIQPISDTALRSLSLLVDLAIPAFTDYVCFPEYHDLMPDLWAAGERSCTYDAQTLFSVLAAHHWAERRA